MQAYDVDYTSNPLPPTHQLSIGNGARLVNFTYLLTSLTLPSLPSHIPFNKYMTIIAFLPAA